MYNLAKLLIDEPHKLERLIILFLKLLITLHVTGLIFGYDLSVGSIIENPIPKTASAIQVIYFFVIVVAAWFVLWGVIAEILLYDVLIGLLSNIGNDRAVFIVMMWLLGVAEEKDKKLFPKGHIISFADSLNDFHEDTSLEETHSRIKEYFLLTAVAYTILIISSHSIHLTKAEIIVGAILLGNFFFGCIFVTKLWSYMSNNIDSLQREFQPLAYGEKIVQAMIEIKSFENYERPLSGVNRRFTLQRTSTREQLPEVLTIVPAFHWNQSLGQKYLYQLLLARKGKKMNQNRYEVVVTNIPVNDDISSAVKSQDNLAYIYAQDEKEIFLGLEEWIQLMAPHPRPIPRIAQPEQTITPST